MLKQKYLLFVLVLLGSCKTYNYHAQQTAADQFFPNAKLYTALYIQRAAEYKALCFQAYNSAALYLDEALKNNTSGKPPAIVTDIDETILDNTPNSVHQAHLGKDFEQAAWNEWTAKASADTVAGALTFFKYAASRGVQIFYVTNRYHHERAATLNNLQKYNFPYADEQHLLLRTTTAGKEPRRETISQNHEIIMLCGDNLSDFTSVFDKKSEEERTRQVKNNAALFGRKFIVLPNPNYGDWESAIYDYNYRLTPRQKADILKTKAKTY
ncbi:5'-nucleotidase, lipoprotein e(P4) family [Haoranjiania flava]|uniref:5'-nucleotidase, lipoprotein e(P4) family n=1 Tax=Haoranjiania flava TaxID=1856322 RepID=A0AAE3LJ13_9BACT|nr:5'-nucleotidase, lipoprotein e(P4) family [Haoranjiania flava]MCU7693177.1 5'-nucleotidase, lipoprotein e(P4) family [Haoranjiania flava]